MKKILTVLAASLAAFVLVSCNKNEETPAPAPDYPASLQGAYAFADTTGTRAGLFIEQVDGGWCGYYSAVDADDTTGTALLRYCKGAFVYEPETGYGKIDPTLDGNTSVRIKVTQSGTTDSLYVAAITGGKEFHGYFRKLEKSSFTTGFWTNADPKRPTGETAHNLTVNSLTDSNNYGYMSSSESIDVANITKISDFYSLEAGVSVGLISLVDSTDGATEHPCMAWYDNAEHYLLLGDLAHGYAVFFDQYFSKAPQYPATSQIMGVWQYFNSSSSFSGSLIMDYNLGGQYGTFMVVNAAGTDTTFVEGNVQYYQRIGMGVIVPFDGIKGQPYVTFQINKEVTGEMTVNVQKGTEEPAVYTPFKKVAEEKTFVNGTWEGKAQILGSDAVLTMTVKPSFIPGKGECGTLVLNYTDSESKKEVEEKAIITGISKFGRIDIEGEYTWYGTMSVMNVTQTGKWKQDVIYVTSTDDNFIDLSTNIYIGKESYPFTLKKKQ